MPASSLDTYTESEKQRENTQCHTQAGQVRPTDSRNTVKYVLKDELGGHLQGYKSSSLKEKVPFKGQATGFVQII